MHNQIDQTLRKSLGLSMLDWCILQTIYNLAGDKAKYKGWCNASKKYFSCLASDRTLVNRFNELESDGWLEFSCGRALKRTTNKYYTLVIAQKGVQELHGAEIAPVQQLHPRCEKVAHLGVQELHSGGEKVAPNNNINNNIDNNIDSLLKEKKELLEKLEKLEKENNSLKANKADAPKKVAQKKGSHIFPKIEATTAYNPQDKRADKNMPFNTKSAFDTALALDKAELIEYAKNAYQIDIDDQFILEAAQSFATTAVATYANHMGIMNFETLKSKFLSWIESHHKYTSNRVKRKPNKKSDNQNPLFCKH